MWPRAQGMRRDLKRNRALALDGKALVAINLRVIGNSGLGLYFGELSWTNQKPLGHLD